MPLPAATIWSVESGLVATAASISVQPIEKLRPNAALSEVERFRSMPADLKEEEQS